jgi:hypothetical protein
MPLTLRKSKPLDAHGNPIVEGGLYCALQGFACGEGHQFIIKEGDWLKSDHFAVQTCSRFFLPSGSSTAELQTAAQKLLLGDLTDEYEQPPGPVVGSPAVRPPGPVFG